MISGAAVMFMSKKVIMKDQISGILK